MKLITLEVPASYSTDYILPALLALGLAFTLFFFFRTAILWYWKVDKIIENQQKQIDQMNKILQNQNSVINSLSSLLNSKNDPPQEKGIINFDRKPMQKQIRAKR